MLTRFHVERDAGTGNWRVCDRKAKSIVTRKPSRQEARIVARKLEKEEAEREITQQPDSGAGEVREGS